MSRKKTHEEYVAELAVKNPNIEVVGEYINAITPILHRCKIDNYEWKTIPNNILRGTGCPKCANVLKKTTNDYIEELAVVNPNIIVVGQYIDAKMSIKHYCKIHDILWDMSPTNALSGQGCSECGKEKIRDRFRRTHEKYIKELSLINPKIEVLGKYIDSKTPILHRCQIDGYEWYARPGNILAGTGCPKCANNMKKEHDQYVAEVLIKNPDIEVLEKYERANVPVLHKCQKHDVVWSCAPGEILSGRGCCMCRGEKIKNKLQKTHNQYIKELKSINSDIVVIGQYAGNHMPIEHYCTICGHHWYAQPDNILSGKGCPQCRESSGERQIRQWLQRHRIGYTFQQTFHDCRDKNPLPFDFYLPVYHACIEYDGKQHFVSVDFFGGEQELDKQKLHDKIKDEYCKNNDIHLLRIPYFKNVETELNNFFIHLI